MHKNLEEIQISILFMALAGYLVIETLLALKKRRRKDKIVKPSEWVTLIIETDLVHPFQVVYLRCSLIYDLKSDGAPVVKIKKL